MSTRLIAYGVVICACIVGAKALQSHLIATGDARGAARVQTQWNTHEAERSAATARDNANKFRNAERTAHEDQQRTVARLDRDAAAASTVRGLRAEIDRLNQRANPYPAGDAGAAACARDATTVRELFGDSTQAYSDLAAVADGLRDQVIGLQDFARNVCRAGSGPAAIPSPSPEAPDARQRNDL